MSETETSTPDVESMTLEGRPPLPGGVEPGGGAGGFGLAMASGPGRPPTRSEQTLAAVVDMALTIALNEGLQAVSFGEVAKRLGISKSGAFVRSGSLSALRNLVLDEYDRRFAEEIFLPALKEPRGLPRLDAIVERWLAAGGRKDSVNGAIFAVGAFEFRPQDDPMRDRLLESVKRWRATLQRSVSEAMDEGHLSPDTDPAELAFAISSLLIGHMHDFRFVQDPQTYARVTGVYRRLMAAYRA